MRFCFSISYHRPLTLSNGAHSKYTRYYCYY